MDPVTIAVVGGGALLLLLASKKAAAGQRNPDPTPDPTPDRTDPTPDPTPSPLPNPLPPGATPATARTSAQIGPGYQGYVRVTVGDNLSHIASKVSPLVGPAVSWQSIRDDPANLWCKTQTPPSELSQYGLGLWPRYGHTIGVDCEQTPGYYAKRYASGTGTFPVLRVG